MADTTKKWADLADEEDDGKIDKSISDSVAKLASMELKITAKNNKNAIVDDEEPLPDVKDTGLDPESANDTVSVMQADPSSPLYSAKTFEELNLSPELLKGIYGMKFVRPSRIQEVSLPLVLANPRKDFIGQAQSGTGKTACFVLSMLSTVETTVQAPQCICISPTRELSRQIMSVVGEMSKYTNITSRLVLAEGSSKQAKITEQVIVGTAGVIELFIKSRVIDTDRIKMFVLDEADEMIKAQGQGDKTLSIKKNIRNKNHQVLLFSATFPDQLDKLIARLVTPPPNKVLVQREKLSVDGIKQLVIDCGNEGEKFRILADIYAFITIAQSIIFVSERATADALAKRMIADGHMVSLLHGGLEGVQRDTVIDDFRSGKNKVLITTNVLSRGIDIRGITLVINFDIPVTRPPNSHQLVGDPDAYLHRIGRSGRFGDRGVAINFVHDAQSKKTLEQIETFYARKCEPVAPSQTDKIEAYLTEAVQENARAKAAKASGSSAAK